MTDHWHGCPGAIRTRDPRLRTAVLCSAELRDKRCCCSAGLRRKLVRRLVRPGGVEPPTALRSGTHDGYKPSALPIELWAQSILRMSFFGKPVSTFPGHACKWSGWLDSNQRPPASEAGTLAKLSYTLLALRREIESLSPVRQTGRLTRCVTERSIGASGPTRTATECALNALPLPIGVQTRIGRLVRALCGTRLFAARMLGRALTALEPTHELIRKIGGPGRIRTCGELALPA
jgi:hypothetical protein